MENKSLIIGDLIAPIPVIQGGMGVGISLSGLAGAVAKAGGIGIISTAQIGFRAKEFAINPIEENLKAIGEEIQKARKIAPTGIIGVNIMVATKQYEEYVKEAVKQKVDLIISGAGLPTKLPELVGTAKTKIAPIVSSLKSAQVICKLWDRKYKKAPDLVVIEGARAGGHLGFSVEQLEEFKEKEYEKEIQSIISLVKEYAVKYTKKIPVVVAGGIYRKEDLDHAKELGADGVQVATRFVTTEECDAHERFKQAYIDAKKEDIVIVKSPVGMPGRAIKNAFLENVEKNKMEITHCYHCLSHCNPKTVPYCITKALTNSAKGKVDEGLIFCGDNAYRATKLEKVADIMQEFAGNP